MIAIEESKVVVDLKTQLTTMKIGSVEIPIYGTLDDPFVKCSDLLIRVLGYRDCNDAKFYRNMKLDEEFVKPDQCTGQKFFTEDGVYQVFMKSEKPIAKQFQRELRKLLRSLRKQQTETVQQLQNQGLVMQKQIEELKKERTGVIYQMSVHKQGDVLDGKIINVGQTVDFNNRMTSYERELESLRQSVKGREIYLHLLHYKLLGYETKVEIIKQDVKESELRKVEQEYQNKLNSQNSGNLKNLQYEKKKDKCQNCEQMFQQLKKHKCKGQVVIQNHITNNIMNNSNSSITIETVIKKEDPDDVYWDGKGFVKANGDKIPDQECEQEDIEI